MQVSVDDIFEVILRVISWMEVVCHLNISSLLCLSLLNLLLLFSLQYFVMAKCLRDCVLIPIHKGGRDASSSEKY